MPTAQKLSAEMDSAWRMQSLSNSAEAQKWKRRVPCQSSNVLVLGLGSGCCAVQEGRAGERGGGLAENGAGAAHAAAAQVCQTCPLSLFHGFAPGGTA